MTPYHVDPLVTVYLGDCLEVMAELPDESVDSICTDPPYGLSFMGRHWDHGVPATPFWAEMFRVAKPGAYLLAFGGTRTVHRIATNIEDAGWEIRDMLMHIYASGFPKSLDVSKAIDRAAGAEREMRVNERWAERYPNGPGGNLSGDGRSATFHQAKRIVGNPLLTSDPVSDLARKWEGWGTALKPAHEPIVMARKPLVGTVAANVTRYGTGALNIDGTRIGTERTTTRIAGGKGFGSNFRDDGWVPPAESSATENPAGRWPSNVLLSDTELFDDENPYVVGSGATGAIDRPHRKAVRGTDKFTGQTYNGGETFARPDDEFGGYGDSGGYSRFFIIPKADRAERERGLAGREVERTGESNWAGECNVCGSRMMLNGKTQCGHDDMRWVQGKARANVHPTVKPIDLMRHLVRLVTPPGGVTLDPFAGSGTTGLAASEEGIKSILIEREPEYAEIIVGRLMATPMGLGLDVPAGTKRRALPSEEKLAERGKTYPGRIFNNDANDEEPAA